MKILAIDYGTKKIGLAISSDDGTLAFPYDVIASDKKAAAVILRLCREKNIRRVVIGLPLNFKREYNPLVRPMKKFLRELKQKLPVPVLLYDETFSTQAARRLQDERRAQIDASAAALILDSYLISRRIQENE